MVVFTAPLSLAGVGGHTTTTKTNPTITSLIGVVAGLPWTRNFARVRATGGGLPPPGVPVFSTTTSTGTDLRRADFIGQLNLVTPLHIETTLINTDGRVEFRPGAAFVRLNLHFVPEPGTVALVLGALLALALGFRRQRRVSR